MNEKHQTGEWFEQGTQNALRGDTLTAIEQEGFGMVCAILDHEGNSVERILRAVNAHDALLQIARDILPEGDDYSDGKHCDECGTAKSRPDQTQCDVPGCFYVRIRAAIAKAT